MASSGAGDDGSSDDATTDATGDDATGGDATGDDATSDDATTGNDAMSTEDAPVTHGDAGPMMDAPSDAPDAKGPGPDASTCSSCIPTKCPTQQAACAAGTACDSFRQCQAACPLVGANGCMNACGAKNPTGKADFAALMICVINACGAGCAIGL
jgi:hypothetical protein